MSRQLLPPEHLHQLYISGKTNATLNRLMSWPRIVRVYTQAGQCLNRLNAAQRQFNHGLLSQEEYRVLENRIGLIIVEELLPTYSKYYNERGKQQADKYEQSLATQGQQITTVFPEPTMIIKQLSLDDNPSETEFVFKDQEHNTYHLKRVHLEYGKRKFVTKLRAASNTPGSSFSMLLHTDGKFEFEDHTSCIGDVSSQKQSLTRRWSIWEQDIQKNPLVHLSDNRCLEFSRETIKYSKRIILLSYTFRQRDYFYLFTLKTN
jgi:hypothetical protein